MKYSDDVMKQAEEAIEQVDIYGAGDNGGSEIHISYVREAIAYAIMADRQRLKLESTGSSYDDAGDDFHGIF